MLELVRGIYLGSRISLFDLLDELFVGEKKLMEERKLRGGFGGIERDIKLLLRSFVGSD